MDVVARVTERQASRQTVVKPTLLCLVSLAAILLLTSMGTRIITGLGAEVFGLPRQIPVALFVVFYALLAVVSYRNLKGIASRPVRAVGIAGASCFAPALAGGLLWDNEALFMVGTVLFATASVWVSFLFACCLVRLPSLRAAAVAAVGGTVLWQLALFVASSFSNSLELAAVGVMCAGVAIGLTWGGAPLLQSVVERAPLAVVELTNPLSSLHVSPRLYGCVFLVSTTYYGVSAFGVPGFGALRMTGVVVLLGILYLLLIQQDAQEDRLFSLVVVLLMAGLLTAPLGLDHDSFVSHTCTFLGARCFDILLWLVIYGLGVRNTTVMVTFFGWTFCLSALGRLVGNVAGGAAVAMVGSHALSAQAAILGLALFFFCFMWLGFRDFSFTRAIRGVDVLDAVEPSPDRVAEGERVPQVQESELEARCRSLAEAAALTPREVEIFELLARGRNAQFIMDTLTITRNTAKAHIKHVYTKLGVHSQQELLTLVEGGVHEG